MNPQKPESATGAATIVRFAQAVYYLNNSYSQYRCILSECQVTNLDRMTQEQKSQVTVSIQQLRKSIYEAYILYSGLAKVTKTKSQKLEKEYKNLDDDFVIKREMAEKIVVEINGFLVEKTVKRLLETSEDIIEQVYTE